MRTLIGIVTFGNHEFTRLCLRAIKETVYSPHDILVVVGKPGDIHTTDVVKMEMLADAPSLGVAVDYIRHGENHGFPASLNDIYDYAWPSLANPPSPWKWKHDYDNLIICGNDVIPYPGAIDAMIETADTTDWEWVCSSQFDSKSLVAMYPETAKYFVGEKMVFSDFSARPWEAHKNTSPDLPLEQNIIKDVRNLCLFKRSVHEKIGYADVNFWPGGYFEDNDYCKRALAAGIKACGLPKSQYFHFWSRTINQGDGTTSVQFERNKAFYEAKWGGAVNEETKTPPLSTPSRSHEKDSITHWQTLAQ